jgi:hypothetical protein
MQNCGITLKKAFDTIDHQIILLKLKNYGVDENSLTWFHSTSSPGLQCEDEGRDEETLVWAGHVST